MANCPVCGDPMAAATVGGVTVDGCQQCGGVWFDREELTRLARGDLAQLQAIDRAFEAKELPRDKGEKTGTCPRCSAGLIRFEPPRMAGLALLACPSGHGVWLREDDFEPIVSRVAEWRARGGETPTARVAAPRERLRDIAHALLSRVCPKCQQPNATASPLCWACGAALGTVQGLFVCPSCKTTLDSFQYAGTPLNRCGQCGGLWLDSGELGALLQLDREALQQLQTRLQPGSPGAEPSSAGDPLDCPACSGVMHSHEYGAGSGVLIHSCNVCRGLWIDPNALVPIQQFVQYNESYLAPPPASPSG